MLLKQGNTTRHIPFLMIDSTDHITGKTGLTVTVTLSKNCGAFGAVSGVVTEIGNGWYKLAANATDAATLGALVLHATATGADPVDDRHEVVLFDPDTMATQTGNSYTVVTDVSNGNAAIKTAVDGVATKTNNLPTDPADASDVAAAITALGTSLGSSISGIPAATLTAIDTATYDGVTHSQLKKNEAAIYAGGATVTDNGDGTETVIVSAANNLTIPRITQRHDKVTGARATLGTYS